MSTGSILFFGLIGLYLIGGPLVLLVIYVMLDRYARKSPIKNPAAKPENDNPFLWTPRDVKKILSFKARLKNNGSVRS